MATPPVVLLAGAHGALGTAIARGLLEAGARVAAAVARGWQVDRLRDELGRELGSDRLLVSVVAPRDGEAAAGLAKGATDALGTITTFVGAARVRRAPQAGREPAADLDELLEANLHTNTVLARAVAPRLRRAGRGELRFVLAPVDAELSATCRASQQALAAWCDGLAADLRPNGVTVQASPAPLDDADAAVEVVRGIVSTSST